MFNFWFNQRTGNTETHPDKWSLSANAAEMRDMVPQHEAALSLYDLLIEVGNSPADAAIYVLEATTGTPHTKPIKTDPG